MNKITDEAPHVESPVDRLVMLPAHPCYLGDGEYDHNWEFQDESFDHEFGTETVHYFCCTECEAVRDVDDSDYSDYET